MSSSNRIEQENERRLAVDIREGLSRNATGHAIILRSSNAVLLLVL